MRAESPLHRHLDALLAALKGSLRLPRQQRRAQARRLARFGAGGNATTAGSASPSSGLGLHLLAAALAAIGTPAGLMANPQGALGAEPVREWLKQRWSRKTEHADKWKSCSDGRG
jgi:hypothetical protein